MPSPGKAVLPRGRLRHRILRLPESAAGFGNLVSQVAGCAPICRICWEGDGGLMTNTCCCAGSLAYVHAHCLLMWRKVAHDPKICATCKRAIKLPAGMERKVWIDPKWTAAARQELSRLRRSPLACVFKWWNRGAVVAGVLGGVASAQVAWTAAPGVAMRLRQIPLTQRSWPILMGVLGVSLHQCAWLPWLQVSQRTLGLHALCYALEAAMDSCGVRLAETLMGGSVAATLGTWISKCAVLIGMGLQVAAMQQIHPMVRFVSGYIHGVERACAVTGSLLERYAALLLSGCSSCSSTAGASSSRELGKKARFLLKVFKVLPFLMHSFAQSLVAAGLLRL